MLTRTDFSFRYRLVLNGKAVVDKVSQTLVKWGQSIGDTADIVTVGCNYRFVHNNPIVFVFAMFIFLIKSLSSSNEKCHVFK